MTTDSAAAPARLSTPDAVYPYCDEQGQLLYEVIRFPKKEFRLRRPDVDGGYTWNLNGVRRVPYRLNEVVLADEIVLCEGEKDCETLRSIDIVASTNPGGSGGWNAGFADYFRAKNVVVVPDQDEPGYKWAGKVLPSLYGIARSVKRVDLPGLNFGSGGDVTDWMNSGHSKLELLEIFQSTDEWEPAGFGQNVQAPVSFISGPTWPEPMHDAYYGLAGEIIDSISPATEADPAGLLAQFLLTFGNVIGRSPHFNVSADRHGANLFCTLVGRSAVSRKGTSWSHIKRIFAEAESSWAGTCIQSGLSSGEGLIWAIRDPIEERSPVRDKGRTKEFEWVQKDPGVEDKRLLVVESEFASTLRVIGREGNTLSAIVRQAWDSGDLRILSKNNPARSTGSHICIIGHITKEELLRCLSTTEMANGFANRFLFVCVQRSKSLPDGGDLDAAAFKSLGTKVHDAIVFARSVGQVKRDDAARRLWHEVYPDLSEGEPGLLGGIISRAVAQVLRLSLIYALLDFSALIKVEHLNAALDLWDYCAASARYVFGDSLGDPVADQILRALRSSPEGLSRTQIRDMFDRHKQSGDIDKALGVLQDAGVAKRATRDTGGRPVEMWHGQRRKREKGGK